jgi:uncharacterized protein
MPDTDLESLQAWLDTLPADLDPLDVVMLDGYLCGLLLHPQPVALARWLPHVFDVDGRAAPAGLAEAPAVKAIDARHQQLDRAIGARLWFDPWVFALDGAAAPGDAVVPWVAGFATALALFPLPQALNADPALIEPLALLYRHLDPEDLEDAAELLAEIDTLEPVVDLAEAVEDLVRAVLLIADLSRPPHPASARGAVAARNRTKRRATSPGRRR